MASTMPTSSSTALYAELLSNIRQVSVIAALHSPSQPSTKLELIKDGSILVLHHNGQKIAMKLPAPVVVLSKLVQPAVGITEASWRFPVAGQSPSATAADFSDATFAPWSASKLSSNSQISCKRCQNNFVVGGTIKIWKDLPSENWAEMMDFWHCHKPHNHETHEGNSFKDDSEITKGYGANQRIGAEQSVGFVDLTYLLLHQQDFIESAVSTVFLGFQETTFLEPLSFMLSAGIKKETGLAFTSFQWLGRRYKYPK
jgi:hypothetical protein